MKLSELLNEAGMKLWKDKEGCQTFHSQARRCVDILEDPNIEDIDTQMVDKYAGKPDEVVQNDNVRQVYLGDAFRMR